MFSRSEPRISKSGLALFIPKAIELPMRPSPMINIFFHFYSFVIVTDVPFPISELIEISNSNLSKINLDNKVQDLLTFVESDHYIQ